MESGEWKMDETKTIAGPKEFFPAMSVSATLMKTPSGNYVVNVTDLNGAVEIATLDLDAINEWVKGEIKGQQ